MSPKILQTTGSHGHARMGQQDCRVLKGPGGGGTLGNPKDS